MIVKEWKDEGYTQEQAKRGSVTKHWAFIWHSLKRKMW
jgi:hypothetical protein